ncbi:cellulose binding domain-containing protein [Streptomyces corynorhini]|uniref:Cellulose-binding protein n=1 Tax=Streptomyces corynorhini TaxID=2282652 RepID=A0A370B448_9ACTN|nr:cellulose binding domain-containing protein [Streptomyces corynorhini]RDG35442.1 cellulose-binding protein [Streptomyces corynorhini]
MRNTDLRHNTALRAVLAVLALTALTVGGLLAHPDSAASAAADPVRIMPLGDSITGSPGCWRAVLGNRLQETGYAVDFVGTLGPQGCPQARDGDNEGHGGALVTDVAAQSQLPGWLDATHPDIVVMHFGTNDVWNAVDPERILAAYDTLLGQMRANNPDMRILVAQLIPMNPSGCAECAQRVVALNSRIPGWAAARSTSRSPVTAVDQWTGFSTSGDTYDGVHPNSSGDDKIAARWYPALTALLTPGGTGPTPTPPATPTPTPTPSAPGSATCGAALRTVSSWQDGYQAEVTVRNTGAAPLSRWTVRLAVPAGEEITQVWNGALTRGPAEVSVDALSWNGALAAGESTAFGLLASRSATAGSAITVAGCAAG